MRFGEISWTQTGRFNVRLSYFATAENKPKVAEHHARAEGAESATSNHGAFDAKSCSAALWGVPTGNYRIAGLLPKLRRTTQQQVMRLDGGIPNVADKMADHLQTLASGLRPDFGCALPYGKMIQRIEF